MLEVVSCRAYRVSVTDREIFPSGVRCDRVGQGKRDAALVVCFPANFCVCIEFDVQRRIQHGACALWQAVTVCERKPDDSGRKCGFGQAADVTGVQGQGG